MQGSMIFLLFAMIAMILALSFAPITGRTEMRARKQLCQQLAGQVQRGEASLADYLMTDCSAKNLTEGGEED